MSPTESRRRKHIVQSIIPPPQFSSKEYLFKILVIGDQAVGKTSILKQYVHHRFDADYRMTTGVDIALRILHWDEKSVVRAQLWDIAGQDRYRQMTGVYYREAVGCIIVFDVTNQASFNAVQIWKDDLDDKVRCPDGSPIPCLLLANKCDQLNDRFFTKSSEIDTYCKQNGFLGWSEVSAKENINLEESIKSLISKLVHNADDASSVNTVDNHDYAIRLHNQPAPDQKSAGKSCGC